MFGKIKSAFGFGKDAKVRKEKEAKEKERREEIVRAKDLKAYLEYSTTRLAQDYKENPVKFYVTPYDRLMLEHEIDLERIALDYRLLEADGYSELQLRMLYEMERQNEYEFYMILTVILLVLGSAFLYGVWL